MSLFGKGGLKAALKKAEQLGKQAYEAGKDVGGQALEKGQKVGASLQDQYQAVKDNPEAVANQLEISAFKDRVVQAKENWLSVYIDETLNGAKEGEATGLDILNKLQNILTSVGAEIKTVTDRRAVADVITALSAVTSADKDKVSLDDLYVAIDSAVSDVISISTNDKLLAQLTKMDKADEFVSLVAGYNYQERCMTVANKCKSQKLCELAESKAAETLNVSIFSDVTEETLGKDRVKQSVSILKTLEGTIDDNMPKDLSETQKSALYDLSEDFASYNLSMSVSKTAKAITSHYGSQITNSAKAITGQALNWIAKKTGDRKPG